MKILEEVMRLRFTLHPRFGPISGVFARLFAA